ncbi:MULTISPECIES: 2-succinylbenzoate--CoA ligase [Planktothricoides]|uniref:2-succinylbenzoate--CoA ligase n=1 Tax=Planktothricoides raciborskii FACHB-1370 TaxID=2949576 RepID=A0ABR8EDI6_9CYAN|nr:MULTISPECIES: 2-succinylbenzoate--CoA ligase [Planktothricoides]KOR35284.1 O-succinylbenzoic acid--CoA ligase [Planktothricoides sp. SR001]MBD2543765.1 2-succinylbenzoate--CoA ligase [Planktothricoides raciborskii FACHB-1370]MBD2582340.1 2-succinylbenzoate--CoA ligase [Planktothricoides raciborskii FACHB-1261]
MNYWILSTLTTRNHQGWLKGIDGQKIEAIAQQKFQEISDRSPDCPGKIILCDADPEQFIGNFIAAVEAKCPIFLANPHWQAQEWQQVFDYLQPDIIWGNDLAHLQKYLKKPATAKKSDQFFPLPKNQAAIMIPTGGSSGKIRFTIHTWETLTASVSGFTEYFQVSKVNSFCVLPLYHVSGLMQFIRSFTTGGTLAIFPSYKEILNVLNSESREVIPCQKYLQEINPENFFISLVPTQLSRFLEQAIAADWLSQFATVLLGGAPPWPELLEKAREYHVKLAPTYGMTETASQIVTLKPSAFLAGNQTCGQVLPHAQVRICNEDGQPLGVNQIGLIKIRAKSLALGYYPDMASFSLCEDNSPEFTADDLGFFDADGDINIVGRRSDKIITGGENVFPAEVEAAIRTTGLVADVCAIALPDPDWGQAIAAVYVPNHLTVSPESLKIELVDRLAKYKQPKHWVPVTELPRNAQGKINRVSLYQIAQAWRLSQPQTTN